MLDPSSVVRHSLPNGLTILIRRDTSAPVAAVVTYVKAGYFDETDEVVGIAHVLEHMFFKGTPTRGVGEIARETKAGGGYLNAHTIYDHTSYFAVLPRESFARGLEIQADAYAHALIDRHELAKELEVIIQEAKRKADSPAAVSIETLYELLHDRHRIRRWRIGRETGLRALTREQLVGFYGNFYRPSNTVLVIVGDVDVDQAMEQVERLYGSLEPGIPVRAPGDVEVERPGFRYRELEGDIAQTQIAIGWRTPGTLHPDTVPLDVLAMIMGSGRASRLYRAVREQQLAAVVSAENYTPTEIGVFSMHAEGPPARAREAARAMWGEVRVACEDGVGPDEVERARRVFEARWLRRLETMEGQANFLAEWEALGDWRLAEEYFEKRMAVTGETAVETGRRYLAPAEASVVVYRPRNAGAFAAGIDETKALLNGAGQRTEGSAFRSSPVASSEVPPRSGRADLERIDGAVFVFRTRRGVPILVRQRRGTPLVHFGVFSGVGAAHDPVAASGIATVASRTMLKGTQHRSAEQIAYESEVLGGSIAASVSADGAGWTFSVPKPRLEESVQLLADVVQHPRFAEAAFETERVIALANLAELHDDMYRYPMRLVTAAAYGAHPYARSVLGTEESLRAIDPGGAQRWHAEGVLAAPTIIAIVGDVEDAPTATLLATAFDELQATPRTSIPAPEWGRDIVELIESRDREQTALAMAFPGPARLDNDRFAAHLIAGVTSGLGGRFFDVLRDTRSLAYTVHTSAVERASAGAFVAYIATSPSREAEARAGLLAEFQRLREEPVTDEELQRAQRYTLGTHAIALQSGGTLLGEMVDAWLYGAGLHELDEFETRVRGVTAESMRVLAAKYFEPARRAEGIVRGHKR